MGKQRFALLLLAFFFSFYSFFFHLSHSHAETLHGTPQDDTIISTDIYDGIISYEGDDTIVIESSSQIIGDSQQTVESIADADVIAIDAGSGDDQMMNSGNIGANADAMALPGGNVASRATADAAGISTQDGADLILNLSDITATATSDSETSSFLLLPPGLNLSSAEASAMGIDAGGNDDQITNSESIHAVSEATTAAEDGMMPPMATAHSTGIDGSSGNDGISNIGDIDVIAVSESESIDVSLTRDVEGGGISEANAEGIQGDDGDDQVTNTGQVKAEAEANANSESVVMTLGSFGTYAAPTTSTAKATGIDGGSGNDMLMNTGSIEANANSHAYTGSGTVTALQYEAVADADARTEATATAIGMKAGIGEGDPVNTGTVTLTANATSTAVDVSIEVLGDVKANASTTSSSNAVGIVGGTENDGIINSGIINMKTMTAVSESSAVDVKMVSIPTAIGEKIFDADLGDAKTAAETNITGIAGGKGDDTIENSGTIDIFTFADSDSHSVKAALTITSSPKVSSASAALLGPPSVAVAANNVPLPATPAENSEEGGDNVDAGTNAEAFVTGIDGDDGMDKIYNTGKITVKGESDADSESVTPTISIAKGGFLNIFPGMSLAEAGTTAHTVATGIDGGSGRDMLSNEDELLVEANAYSTSASIAVLFKEVTTKGLAWGGALSNTDTDAVAASKGILGGEDDDVLENSGTITVTATPDTDSSSISATLMGAKEGLVAGFTYADVATTADGTAIGIEGGAGNDTITNTSTGEIYVTSEPTSTSASVGATIEGAFSQEWSAILGGAIADATTRAVSTVTGVDAGEDDDTVTNAGKITLTANPDADSASVVATLTGAEDGLTAGFTYADGETTAEATAVGISGGAGDDTITNAATGQIEVTADPESTSASVGVTVSGVTKGTGIVGGAAMADGTTEAVTTSSGIDGNEGSDVISNEGKIIVSTHPDVDSGSIVANIGISLGELGLVGGFSYADNGTTSRATAVGINGGADNDSITNTDSAVIEVTTGSTSTSASIGVTVELNTGLGAAVGAALTDGTSTALSNATGINGGYGEDSIDNSGAITVDSQSTAKSTSVSVDIVGGKEGAAAGVSYADATTTSEATAAGIASQGDIAKVTSNGTIVSTATATTDSESVSITTVGEKIGLAAGVSLADLTTKATATSYGIDTGETASGNGIIDNLGTVDVDATATTKALSVATTLAAAKTGITAGVSAAGSDVTATSTAVGLRTGWGDDAVTNDRIENEDGYSLDSYAHSVASSDDVAVTASAAWEGVALGASLAKADTRATAIASGIETGEGDDTVTSESGIRAESVSNVTSNIVSVDVAFSYKGVSAGVALSSTKTDSIADTAGISGGGGNDEIINRSSLDAEATATTKTDSITINIATVGAAISDASSTAAAEAVGLDGGRGVDFLTNEGDITAISHSTADDTETTVNFSGKASGNVESTATARATGIRGDATDDAAAAGDTVKNLDGGSLFVESHARLDAAEFEVQGGGAVFANAAGAIEALAAGIVSGAGLDTVVNEGSVDVTARTYADVSSMELQLTGVAAGKAGADLTTRATGIDAGQGANSITNARTGTITVNSDSNATAVGLSVNLGITLQRAAIAADTHSSGIKSGDDKDTIHNEGNIVVTADTSMGAVAGDISLVGLSTADSVVSAFVEGINAGGGGDEIVNTGSITVGNIPGGDAPMAFAEVANVSISFSKIGLGFLGSKSQATGILGGGGDDVIENDGTISIGNSDWMSESKTVGFQGNFLEFFSLTGAGASGETISKGIDGGQGNDDITNYSNGVLDVKATAYAFSDGAADVVTFGDPTVFANATTETTATAASGGQGDDTIVNLGSIIAESEARADTSTDAWVGWGNPTADSYSHAVATTWGIDASEGMNHIHNEGEISANSLAGAYSFAKADSNVDTTDSKADSWAEAFSYGIVGGNDGNTVFNTGAGKITVEALARTHDPQTGMETKADSDEKSTAKTSKPVTAYSAGISLGDGDDTMVNDGRITVDSQSDARTIAENNSWPNSAQSDATAVGEATAKGIATGGGENWVVNNGQILVGAWGNADPSADSFSRDDTSSTTAFADAEATAIGMEGNGDLLNAASGNIEIKARATAHAETGSNDPESEETTATAGLTANATGIATGTDTIRSDPDRIGNDGSITVVASTGEDDTANPEFIAEAVVNTDSTENEAEARGAAEAVAAGIRVGNNSAEITNTGDVSVLGRARAHLSASSDEDSDAVTGVDEDTAVRAEASGIEAGGGDNTITNTDSGLITVDSVVTTFSFSLASSTTDPANATSKTGGATDAAGIKVGDGDNTIRNYKALKVTAENRSNAMSLFPEGEEHLDKAYAYAGAKDTSLTSNAAGISVGNGGNVLENHNDVIVSSTVDARADAYSNTASADTFSEAQAGGQAQAIGIIAGEGQNLIGNYQNSSITVIAKADLVAWGFAEEVAHAHVGSEGDPGAITEAIGFSAGNGVNEIINGGKLEVRSMADSEAWALAGDSTSASAVSYAIATGIRTGDGVNEIVNNGELTVGSLAQSEATASEGGSTEESYATATGIRTGDGNNRVENYVSIEVTSVAIAADAMGIQTANGDDLIINGGSIVTKTIENGVSSSGMAISSGAGNDQVFLLDASESDGQINLGDGDDRLTMTGSPLVTDNVTGAAGTDTLVFEEAGNISFTPAAFENAVKQGTGTFTIPNLPTMQRIEVNEGTLQIESSYAMADDSSFKTYMNGDGSHGQLKVDGTAQLAGDLRVVNGPGPYINGTTYDIIQADVLNGVFGSEALPEDKPLLSFQTHTYSDRFEVEALAKSFTTVAANSLQRTIAQHLDNIIPKATGDLSLVLGDFQALSESDFNEAFASLSPDSYDISTRITSDIARIYLESLHQRMHSLRANLTSPSTGRKAKSNKDPILLAYNGPESSIGQILSETQRVEKQKKAGMWATIFGQWGDQDEEDGYTAFDYSIGGLTFGLDYLMTDSLIAGLSIGYADTKIDLDRDSGDGNIESLGGSIYGTYFNKHTYVETVLSYGDQNYDNNRNIAIGPLLRTAHSEHDGNVFSAYGAGGYSFQSKEWIIRPFGSMQYVYLDEDGFQESGAGSISLRVDGRKTESLVSNLGFRFARVFEFESGRLVPEASLAWQYDFDIDDRNITTSFVGSPGNAFTIEGQDLENHSAKIGIGLTFINKRNFSFSLDYNAEFRKNYNSQGIIGYLSLTF